MALLDRFRSLPAHKHPDPEVRLEYIEGLSIDQRDELSSAVLAVDRLPDRADLEQIASRSNNKGAVKRARGLLRDMDERAAQEAAAATESESPDQDAPAAAERPAAPQEVVPIEDARQKEEA